MRVTPNIGLTAPSGSQDVYSYQVNAQNLYLTDYHDHSPGRGARLTGASIVPGSLGGYNLAANAGITNSQLANYGLSNGIATLNSSGKVPTSQIEPLVPTISSSTTINALNGQQIIVTSNGNTNVNLPTHAAGQLIGITNYNISGVSSSPITTVSGTNIYGIGLSQSGASYFNLGAYGASVILLDDGTNWRIISGQQDSGWLSIANNSANTIDNSRLFVRQIGDKIFFKGYFVALTSLSPTSPITIFTLPSALYINTISTYVPAFSYFNEIYILNGSFVSGAFTFTGLAGATIADGQIQFMDGASFFIN